MTRDKQLNQDCNLNVSLDYSKPIISIPNDSFYIWNSREVVVFKGTNLQPQNCSQVIILPILAVKELDQRLFHALHI